MLVTFLALVRHLYLTKTHKMIVRLLPVLFLLCSIHNLKATNIDTTRVVEIGGIQQFISIQGKNLEAPLLLYLHGGPGAAASAHKEQITSSLEKDFIVIHWDQRASGRTLELNTNVKSPNLDLMKSDAEEILQFLLNEFKREELVLVGNSWGSILGFHLAEKFPEKIRSLFAISPLVNLKESQQTTLQILKRHYSKTDHKKAVNQLSKVSIPNTTIEDMVTQYRWQSVYDGEHITDEQIEQFMPFFNDWSNKWFPLYKELFAVDLKQQIPNLNVPVYMLLGAKDYTTYYKISEQYFNQLEAPQKQLFWFEEAAHNIPATASGKMQEIILKHGLPSK